MRNFDRINALPPQGIENKRAHIIGGGIAGLAAAAFLIDDAHMPPASVTIYESLPVVGGSMDAAGGHVDGYTSRGERELEARMECLWYLCSKVPSLRTPGLTILDETHAANLREPIHSNYRLMERCGSRHPTTGPLMSPEDGRKLLELLMTPEAQLENLAVDDWFTPAFTRSIFWLCWSSMLAFRDYHSLIEVKRYLARFAMYASGLPELRGILHTEYNEYDSIIHPLQVWLESRGLTFRTQTEVLDIETHDEGGETVAAALVYDDADGRHRRELNRDDLVFFTNGSMTQGTRMGDTQTAVALDRDTRSRGCFTVWEKLAARDSKFGRPETFTSDVDRTNWYSFFPTITGHSRFFDFMQAKTGSAPGTGGGVTIVDSSWKLSFVMYGKYFPDQPDDVQVLWAYGQVSDVPGDFIKKPMQECTGAEMLAELLYHCGLEAEIDDILAHSAISTAAMPYITSQFMPRRIADRPKVIPEGCVNLAFIGQFVELPGDVVFTVETSVRTAMMAVWGLTGLAKPMVPLFEPLWDLRVIADNVKVATPDGRLTVQALRNVFPELPKDDAIDALLSSLPLPAA